MAPLNSSSAVASLNRLSPLRTTSVLRGIETAVSTADAAAASGGATIAPKAIAAAMGKPMKVHPTHATTAAVTNTAKIASATNGPQNRRAAPGGKSYAASTNAGAMKSANAVSGAN